MIKPYSDRRIKVWVFDRYKHTPLRVTGIHSVTFEKFLSYFNEDLISCQGLQDYFVIKLYYPSYADLDTKIL